MNTYRYDIKNGNVEIPAIMIEPAAPKGAAVVIHGYGGCKEEQLGMAWRIAEKGLAVCTIDLRGHGQHANLLDQGIVSDVNAAITYCRRFGKVTAVGHSLGGRIALVSDADYVIGISPAIAGRFGPPARDNLKSLRAYKVRYNTSEDFLNIFQTVPEWNVSKNKPILILYGTRDIPGIVEACRKINGTYMVVTHEIEDALHTDIYLNEETYRIINKQLRRWSEYKQLNSQV